jgi:hypothetical protein
MNMPDNSSQNNNYMPSGWAPNQTVNVYLDNTQYGSDQISAIEQAFRSWQNSAAATNTSYNFVVGAGQPNPTGKYVVVREQIPNGDSGLGAFTSWNATLNNKAGLNYVNNAVMQINPGEFNPSALTEVVAHEVGHLNYLGECPQCTIGQQVMAAGDIMNGTAGAMAPSGCDVDASNRIGVPGGSDGGGCQPYSCGGGYYWSYDLCACVYRVCGCCCNNGSPILIDVDGSGFNLTDVTHGVMFNISGTGPVQMAWTAQGSTNAFLFLDRNGNGIVDDGTELFGNFTPQPASSQPNGYKALAVYDLPENGGNNDGVIDQNDAVFSQLRLWIDINHDGISQPGELFTLPQLGVHKISLRYHFSYRRDRFGNQFRYRSRIDDDGARVCYDVFLVTAASSGDSLFKEPPIFDLLRPKASCGGIGN